uniref:Uncharacterized protein n=1 Tax=Micrurus surinamensis TaxID=129470 RepID=A0A2D4NNP5_MICSU
MEGTKRLRKKDALDQNNRRVGRDLGGLLVQPPDQAGGRETISRIYSLMMLLKPGGVAHSLQRGHGGLLPRKEGGVGVAGEGPARTSLRLERQRQPQAVDGVGVVAIETMVTSTPWMVPSGHLAGLNQWRECGTGAQRRPFS